jgi:hypothetical protein
MEGSAAVAQLLQMPKKPPTDRVKDDRDGVMYACGLKGHIPFTDRIYYYLNNKSVRITPVSSVAYIGVGQDPLISHAVKRIH